MNSNPTISATSRLNSMSHILPNVNCPSRENNNLGKKNFQNQAIQNSGSNAPYPLNVNKNLNIASAEALNPCKREFLNRILNSRPLTNNPITTNGSDLSQNPNL